MPPVLPHPLCRALRLDEHAGTPIVAFVGGGGKTTALFTLATELAAAGQRVVTTTTTRLFASQRAESPAWCPLDALEGLGAQLDRHGQCLVTAADEGWEDGKARGVPPETVVALAARPDVDALLVEADGSRTRPFKAPAPHEPVIPAAASHVVAMVGGSIFGQPLDAPHVHRPERVARIGGVPVGTPVTPDLVARVLIHPEGGRQYVPAGATFLPFINRIEQPADAVQAEECAVLLLRDDEVREVLLGSLHRLRAGAPDALRRRGRRAAVVLAAGRSERFGRPKQLLDWGGRTLVALAAEVALTQCETVLVVAGHEAEAIAHAVEHLPVEVIYNPDYGTGQGSSVAAGARALLEGSRPPTSGVYFLVADQPGLTPSLLESLHLARGLYRIARPAHEGRPGNPVLFDQALLPVLATLAGEAGGRALFDRYRNDLVTVPVADGRVLRDVDTPRAWRALRRDMGMFH